MAIRHIGVQARDGIGFAETVHEYALFALALSMSTRLTVTRRCARKLWMDFRNTPRTPAANG